MLRAIDAFPERTPDADQWHRDRRPFPGVVAWRQKVYAPMTYGEILEWFEELARRESPLRRLSRPFRRNRQYDRPFVASRSRQEPVRGAADADYRGREMGSNDRETSTGRTRTLVRVLVLLAAIGVAALLTRCPLTDGPDTPVPPPRSAVR